MPQVDVGIAFAGLIVGLIVGLTGVGGGALMTPILVLLFHVQPLAAIGSDLVASLFMKPVGVVVHWKRGNVDRDVVKWLLVGSLPTGFAGVVVIKMLGHGPVLQNRIQIVLGLALLLGSLGIVLKTFVEARPGRVAGMRPASRYAVSRPLVTIAIGAVVGLIVGMTSVGSGSLMIVLLMLVYPTLNARRLVGTDLAQAVPLVGSAAVAHVLFGDFKPGLTLSILIGSIPGVYVGSRLSANAPDLVIRPILVFVLFASALKLLNLSTAGIGLGLVVMAFALPSLWGMIDAARWKPEDWELAQQSRTLWMRLQGVGTLAIGIGVPVAIAYFSRVRPQLARAAAAHNTAA